MITYLDGDATAPDKTKPTAIIHVNNNVGAWAAGFAYNLSKRWKQPEERYREWAGLNSPIQSSIPGALVNTSGKFQLGEIQLVQVEESLYIINMIAQEGVGFMNGPPIRYGALDNCLEKVKAMSDLYGLNLVGPRFGAGLAGGSWTKIETLINKHIDNITIYDFVPDENN